MNIKFSLSKLRNLFEDVILTSTYLGGKPKLRNNDIKLESRLLHLKKFGYCRLNNLLKKNEISSIKKCINKLIKNKNNITFHSETNHFSFNKPLHVHPSLSDLVVNPTVLDLVESYFNRDCYVADLDLRRILPVDPNEIMQNYGYSNSSWHRDMRGRQLKLMIYLSDVETTDSNFSFFPKTHKFSFIRRNYLSSRYSDDSKNLPKEKPIEWYGKEGDAYLFDTNIIHRLRRKKNASFRDSFTIYFTPGQELRYLDLDSNLVNINKNPVLQEPKSFYFRSRIKY